MSDWVLMGWREDVGEYLITVCGPDREIAEMQLKSVMDGSTQIDKKCIANATKVYLKEVSAEYCWWRDKRD